MIFTKNQYNEKFEYDPRGNITITLPAEIARDVNYAAGKLIRIKSTDVLCNVHMNLTAGTEIRIIDTLHLPNSCGTPALVIAYQGPCPQDKYTEGFNQQSISGQYTYDTGGNLTYDPNKKLTFHYNHHNLPYKIVGAENDELQMLYGADGAMLQRKYVKNNVQVTKTDYLRGKELKNDLMESVYHSDGRVLKDGASWKYEYYIKDHLGNVRVTFSDDNNNGLITGAELRSRNDYYAFGMEWNNLWQQNEFNNPKNRYKYNGKEMVEEMGLNQLLYGARNFDPVLGRWNSTDPMANKMPFASPYNYCFNNPLKFIDPDGQIPYPITIRGFAPFKSFGFGFYGDNRGYSTGNVSARVHQKINFDTDKRTITTNAWSSSSSHYLNPSYEKTATPSVNFTGDFTINQNGDNKAFGFASHVAAANPLTPPGSPDIDIFSNFSIIENKKAGTLSINGSLKGDNFPSTEAFITDPAGNNVFIGIGQIAEDVNKNTGPFSELPGENSARPITSFGFTISTDKKGNFTGVTEGRKTYSVDDWNKRFTSQRTQK